MITSDRLLQFYQFDEDITAQVEEAAERQNAQTFAELARRYDLLSNTHRVKPFDDDRVLEFIRINPESDYDETKMRVYCAPMANPTDENQAMRAFRLFGSDPSSPLMVVGNPAGVGRHTNKLRRSDIGTVWAGDLTPAIAPALQHLENIGVSSAEFIGYSYGADSAATAASQAHEYSIIAESTVWMEPTSIANRGLMKLMKAFGATAAELDSYVEASESAPLIEARKLATPNKLAEIKWTIGLLRMSNLAIAHALSMDLFRERADRALASVDSLASAVIWGSSSEICDDIAMQEVANELQESYGTERVSLMRMNGMHHAGGDDIDLHAAMVLQGLRNASSAKTD